MFVFIRVSVCSCLCVLFVFVGLCVGGCVRVFMCLWLFDYAFVWLRGCVFASVFVFVILNFLCVCS